VLGQDQTEIVSVSLLLDHTSAAWLRDLADTSPVRDEAIARLHDILLRSARLELRRRRSADFFGPELEDLAHQCADDSVVAVLAKLGTFRGESRFTTWAYRFVILEVSTKLGRHFWRTPRADLNEEQWEELPSRFGLDPQRRAEWNDLVLALKDAVHEELTPHQREIFSAIILQGVPLDALVVKHDSSRNAIYKVMFDARRKLRLALAAKGYVGDDQSELT
jgi:RNA polymerase sigma-70 factor (ECF subfamily)